MELSLMELNAICKGDKHCPDKQSKVEKYQILYHLTSQPEEHETPESPSTNQCFGECALGEGPSHSVIQQA